MKQKFSKVYQFKISLLEIQPTIWRRIQVPQNDSFWDLHVAIQDAMGRLDDHLHQFEIRNPQTGANEFIGIPDDFTFEAELILPGWKKKISDYFSAKNPIAIYTYDFGDNWEHEIVLEEILPAEKANTYPICLHGQHACPPEDCGGSYGYETLLEVMANPQHEEYEEYINWLGGEFDPEAFNPEAVKFDDPHKRFKIAFGS